MAERPGRRADRLQRKFLVAHMLGLNFGATGLDEAPKICTTMGAISSGLHSSMRAVVTSC